MKDSPENEALLKKLGFTRDREGEGWFSLSNGWGFRIDAIKSFPELMSRLYDARATSIIENGDVYRPKDKHLRGWVLVGMEEEEFLRSQKIEQVASEYSAARQNLVQASKSAKAAWQQLDKFLKQDGLDDLLG